MKKLLSVILTMCLVISAFCLPVTALDLQEGYDDSTSDVFDIFGIESILTFEIENGEAILVNCEKTAHGDIEIPSTYKGYPVTQIGRRAFRACAEITAVTLPEGVKVIGEEAFGGCICLETIVIPSTVTIIENGAFVLCEALKEITLPASVTYISPYTFLECVALQNVTLNGAVTAIGQDAFSGCVSLKNINFPSSLTSIGEYAFWGCPIEYLVIPNNVSSIGERAFVEANITTLRFHSVSQMEKFGAEFTANEVICLCENNAHTFTSEYDISCNVCLYKESALAPVVETIDHSTVTLKAVEGYEYSINSETFQSSPVFGGLYVGNEYTFTQRVIAHGGEQASEISEPLTVSTTNFTSFAIGTETADYIKLSNYVEDKQTYKVTLKYTATANTPVSFLTAEDDINVNRGYVEAENFAVKTLVATNNETTAEILFTVDKKSDGGVSQGDALYLYIPIGSANVEISVLSLEKLNNAQGKSVVANGGASILIDQSEDTTQALRFFFSYDTNTANEVVINGKAYALVSRGFLLANGEQKADMLVSREKAKTDSSIIDMNVTDFLKCWEITENGNGTKNLTYSNYVKGFESENGTYNNTERLYVKGYLVIEADGEQYTLYSAETNYTVSEIANMNYIRR